MSNETDVSFVETVAELAKKAGTSIVTVALNEPVAGLPSAIPVLVNNDTGAMQGVKSLFEPHRVHPERKTGTAHVTTLESFIDLVERHKTEHSVIFANTDWRKPSLTAVIDYHEAANGGRADFGKHRIHYQFPLSEEWQAWIDQNGKRMGQADFATWIEDHITELATPGRDEAEEFENTFGFRVAAPNELQQLSRGLAIRAETRAKSQVVLQTGEGEITWEEEHKDLNGVKLVVPGLFVLSLAPFFLGDACRIPVRLRYRLQEGKVYWFFNMYRPDKYITEQIRADVAFAHEKTGLIAFQGAPEMSA